MAPPSPSRRRRLCLLAGLALGVVPVPAAAADLSANMGVVTDYRFRGLSLSDRRPALQGGVDVGLAAGWYVGAWGSTIARYGGSRVEVDLFGGRTGHLAGVDYSIGAAAYLYPRGERVNYAEGRVELSRTFGPTTLAVEGDYVPEQPNCSTANLYFGVRATVALPDSPVSFTVRGGYENGFYAHKLDWEAGVAVGDDHLSASVLLTGTDGGDAAPAGRRGRTGGHLALAASF